MSYLGGVKASSCYALSPTGTDVNSVLAILTPQQRNILRLRAQFVFTRSG